MSTTAIASARLDQRLVIPVEGMTCASCVGRVEKGIRAVAGVRDVSVNLATNRATVDLDAGHTPEPILAAIRKAGFETRDESAELSVQGMTCASCVGRVERALKAVPGVLDGSVNLATGRAHARYVGGDATLAAVAAALGKAGYPAEPVVNATEQTDKERNARAARFARTARRIGLASHITWCAQRRRFKQMQGARRLFAQC